MDFRNLIQFGYGILAMRFKIHNQKNTIWLGVIVNELKLFLGFI